jgi:hypothetical protein
MILRCLLAAIALAVAPLPALAQQAPQPPSAPAPERHAPTSLVFPAHIDQAERYASTDYGKAMNRPDLGYSWNYRVTGLMVATVYLYTLGQTAIPAGAHNPLVLGQFEQAWNDIHGLAKSNRYDELALMKEPADCPVAAIVFRCVTLAAVQSSNKRRVATALMVTGYRNHFVKLRIDWLPGSAPAEAAVRGFIDAFVGTMR